MSNPIHLHPSAHDTAKVTLSTSPCSLPLTYMGWAISEVASEPRTHTSAAAGARALLSRTPGPRAPMRPSRGLGAGDSDVPPVRFGGCGARTREPDATTLSPGVHARHGSEDIAAGCDPVMDPMSSAFMGGAAAARTTARSHHITRGFRSKNNRVRVVMERGESFSPAPLF